MPVWDEREFNTKLEKGQIENLYFLYGEETFLLDEALRKLKETALGDGLADFNLSTFYGKDADVTSLQEALETLPMMAQRRVVILKDAQDFKDKNWEELSSLIEEPVDTTTWICISTKIDKRKKLFKNIQKKGIVCEFRKPFENQIPSWIQYIAKRQGLQIGMQESQIVHQVVGANLLAIDNEMKKLAQYMGDRQNVTIEDIAKVVSQSRIDSVFSLTDAIGARDRAGALECLANLLEHGQNEVGALALITRHVRILAGLQQAKEEGLRGGKLSQRVGVPAFFLKKYEAQSQRWSPAKLRSTYQALLETDRALKASPVSSHIWLENFVIKTCSP